jgi:antitoxin component HigA of HigAB toxin-antitoxin module
MRMRGGPAARSRKERARIKRLLTRAKPSDPAHAKPVAWPKANAHPVDFLEAWMVNSGRTQNDLARLIRSRSVASLVLNRKRTMSLEMIRALVFKWRLPAEPLLVPYGTGKAKAARAKRRPASRRPTPRRGSG